MWHYLWALMETWLMAFDSLGRYPGTWSNIQGSTPNHENKGKTTNLAWMLYLVYAVLSVYAVLGVCCTWCMLYLVYAVLGVCCTQCQLMIMAWWDRQGSLNLVFRNDSWIVNEKERDVWWRWEWCGGYDRLWEIWGTSCLIGLRRLRIGVFTYRIGDVILTCTWNSHQSKFLMMISPISLHLSLSRPHLYHYLRTWS
jgi:hypothetical protein